jgi:glutamyl-tRNA reductase
MTLLACGINHKTAPLSVRELAVFSREKMPEPLVDLVKYASLKEAAILSTCNRTEIYCDASSPISIIEWLHKQQKLSPGMLEPYLYVHQEHAAVRHILRVASGLDSMVMGEPQILGQVKNAFFLAKAAGTLGGQLHRLFQFVFATAKQVRSETTIGSHPVSIAFAAVDLAKHIFSEMSELNVLLVGAGETIELVARHLQSVGVTRFAIANRTQQHAKDLARKISGEVLSLNQISNYLSQADMVICATASSFPILGKGIVESALRTRKHRIMFMVDLSVPRNIEPEVSELGDVYLYTLDDLQEIIQQNFQLRQQSVEQAETIIDLQTHQFMQNLKILEAAPLIRAYRDKAESYREMELSKAKELLRAGYSVEEVLERFARGLTNKLLHLPSVQLRDAAKEEKTELLKAIEEIFC